MSKVITPREDLGEGLQKMDLSWQGNMLTSMKDIYISKVGMNDMHFYSGWPKEGGLHIEPHWWSTKVTQEA
jgi:hypothetical protein